MKSISANLLSIAFISFLFLTGSLSASDYKEQEHSSQEEHFHPNELAIFLGATDEIEDGNTHFTIGGEYERRLNSKFGISAVFERVSAVDEWAIVTPATFRPVKSLKLTIGPGFENKAHHEEENHTSQSDTNRETFFLFRAGAGYSFEFATNLSLQPSIYFDSIRENGEWIEKIVFGASLAIGF